jgi:hypothetical protein
MKMDDSCNCDYWAEKVTEIGSTLFGLAVTFNCPEHGQVTIDARRIPAPSVPRSIERETPPPRPR